MSNISSYSKHKVLFTMTKPRSAYSVSFMLENPKDDWLVEIVRYKTKTGECAHECMVIKPDVERQVEMYEKDGFVKV
jgi:hypothetical protein